MTRKLAWIFAVVALGLAGCGDDKTGSDAKIKLPDKGPTTDGPVTKQDGPITKKDGPATTPDTGGPIAGLGDKCDQTKPCTAPAQCVVTKQGATAGFCTKECPVADFGGKPCTGGPTGTGFLCVLGDKVPTPTKAFCGFVCEAKDQSGKTYTFPCPTQLTCGAADANGTKLCE